MTMNLRTAMGRPLHEWLGEHDLQEAWSDIPPGLQATYVAEAAVAIWAMENGHDVFTTLWEFRGSEYLTTRSDSMQDAYRKIAELAYDWRENQ